MGSRAVHLRWDEKDRKNLSRKNRIRKFHYAAGRNQPYYPEIGMEN